MHDQQTLDFPNDKNQKIYVRLEPQELMISILVSIQFKDIRTANRVWKHLRLD